MQSNGQDQIDYLEQAKVSFRRLATMVDTQDEPSVRSCEAVTVSLGLIAVAEELRKLDKKH
ncbi:hypothetical protein [Streptomyces sp. GC420]|uniref:hypothetical protein n=1 Tax=Streptomyces sp. GC420 TaxID=2697568 RepID=UPI001414CF23|nr:hypothetical protein [Streptomyces sp. GC420]NBM18969.1 hypothetical protein [Streptomyces sp. GC420]